MNLESEPLQLLYEPLDPDDEANNLSRGKETRTRMNLHDLGKWRQTSELAFLTSVT